MVDAGRSKQRLLEGRAGLARFEVRWISQAAAAQRAGRAGRTGPGHCYRCGAAALHRCTLDLYNCNLVSKPKRSSFRLPLQASDSAAATICCGARSSAGPLVQPLQNASHDSQAPHILTPDRLHSSAAFNDTFPEHGPPALLPKPPSLKKTADRTMYVPRHAGCTPRRSSTTHSRSTAPRR